MSSKKEEIVGLADASFDDRCATGPKSWWMIYPSSKKNTPEAIASGGKEFIPHDPPRPFRWMLSVSGTKLKFEAGDLKALENLIAKFRDEIDAGYGLAGTRAKEELVKLSKIYEE